MPALGGTPTGLLEITIAADGMTDGLVSRDVTRGRVRIGSE